MKPQLKSALVIALTLVITTPALAGGIAVIDGAAIATAEKNSWPRPKLRLNNSKPMSKH